MAMTVVVTRNVRERFRGYLASCMCEVAPGVYTAPRMTVAVRDRVWDVLVSWFAHGEDAAVVMTWPDPSLPGGQDVRVLGVPRSEVVEHEGVFLARRDLSQDQRTRLGLPDGREPVPF